MIIKWVLSGGHGSNRLSCCRGMRFYYINSTFTLQYFCIGIRKPNPGTNPLSRRDGNWWRANLTKFSNSQTKLTTKGVVFHSWPSYLVTRYSALSSRDCVSPNVGVRGNCSYTNAHMSSRGDVWWLAAATISWAIAHTSADCLSP